MNATEAMTIIQTIDAHASVHFTQHTSPPDWYASSHAEEGGNGFLSGISGRGDSPEAAVLDLLARLQRVHAPLYIVIGGYSTDRRHFRWNGTAFTEVPR